MAKLQYLNVRTHADSRRTRGWDIPCARVAVVLAAGGRAASRAAAAYSARLRRRHGHGRPRDTDAKVHCAIPRDSNTHLYRLVSDRGGNEIPRRQSHGLAPPRGRRAHRPRYLYGRRRARLCRCREYAIPYIAPFGRLPGADCHDGQPAFCRSDAPPRAFLGRHRCRARALVLQVEASAPTLYGRWSYPRRAFAYRVQLSYTQHGGGASAAHLR